MEKEIFVFLQPQGMLVSPSGQKANSHVHIHVCVYVCTHTVYI